MDHLADLTGKTIGKYRIIKHLGRGGMAEVYQAYQTTLDRSVALKVILPYLNADTDFLRRFEREAKSVAALRHPNIVQVFDYDVEDGLPYMVMEYIEGDSLKMLLDKLGRRGQTLPLPQAVRVAREIAQALGYAHKQGVIHRDVKPGNVMLDKTGRVILMDFGVSKIVGVQTQTASGAATGTPAYMAPEQALGHAVDQRADLYALGVILYQLVTGHLPFEADSALTVMLKQAHDPRPSPRRLRPDLPEGLERVILKSMARDPNERFPAAEMFIDFLNNPGAAAELVVPPSSLLPGDPADRPAWLTEAGAEAGTAPPLTAPAAAESARLPAEQQNVARTVG
nr:serine/threonine protein kinase [Anaerolineales bacterium]